MLTPDAVPGLSREQVFEALLGTVRPSRLYVVEATKFEDWWVADNGPDPLGWLEAWRREEGGRYVQVLLAYDMPSRVSLFGLPGRGVAYEEEDDDYVLACARALLAAKLAYVEAQA